ncbi:MAG TPA: hypothetical protein VIC56_02960 [Gemmatimonadota bacterium]|jgi:hypothetical protein
MAERKCAHQACTCMVSGDDRYCSAHCRDHAAKGGGSPVGVGGCGCGHPGCR